MYHWQHKAFTRVWDLPIVHFQTKSWFPIDRPSPTMRFIFLGCPAASCSSLPGPLMISVTLNLLTSSRLPLRSPGAGAEHGNCSAPVFQAQVMCLLSQSDENLSDRESDRPVLSHLPSTGYLGTYTIAILGREAWGTRLDRRPANLRAYF